jgi:virginiamycin B lyase
VSNFTGAGISDPEGITAGPDGALWFTNGGNNSIGRITKHGVISNYTGTGIGGPADITTGPDGAMWFSNHDSSSIGRITTNVTPEITAITPTSGTPGTTVTIKGRNLSHATAVAFSGTTAPIISDSATKIVTQVPPNAGLGPITVTTNAGTVSSTQTFNPT